MTHTPESRIDLDTGEGLLDVYLFRPDRSEPAPAVIFYMDAFGIRPALAQMAGRLASHGYVVALPNLYYRTPHAPFDAKAVAAGGAERDRFKGMIATLDGVKVTRDTGAVIARLDTESSVRPGAIGVLGYCMGAGYALRAAGAFPARVVVAAVYHGGSLATDKPDSPHLLAGQMRAQVYIGVAEIDPSFPDSQREELERALQAAGVDYVLEVYAGAKHGFAVDGHLVYNRDAAERHWATLVSLLAGTLQADSSRMAGATGS